MSRLVTSDSAPARNTEIATGAVAAGLNLASRAPDGAGRVLARALKRVARSPQQRMLAEWVQEYLAPGGPGAAYVKRLTRQVNPKVRRRFIAGFIASLFFRNPEVSAELKRTHGISAPSLLAISPSMRCNLRCTGCYAGNYSRKDDLPVETVDRVLKEAESIGTRTFIIIGGEPFMWRPLLDLIQDHPNSFFQVFTNATLINEDTADRIVELGNMAPAISIEGGRDVTDARRGTGTYDRVIAAMERLRDRGAIFSFSATASRDNLDEVISEEFIDTMIEKGALYGWYFTYIPIGLNPDLSYMPTPEERDRLRRGVNRIRNTKPILVADFWNDGAVTGGCLAGGRKYLHINNEGDVEPCVFCHFAVDNIKDTSLLDALTSDFFRGIRDLQPFGHNLLRPCPLVDHPGVVKHVVNKYGAYPTHRGADSLIKDELQEGLRAYARGLRDVYAPVWEKEYRWAEEWLSSDANWQERTAAGRDAEEQLN